MPATHNQTLQTPAAPRPTPSREQMDIVVIGHVDHGKSTLVGRLLADTHSLPEGKLEQVRENCRRTAKPFEYAFLLDALKDEQAQGITIDSARCFFRTARREYIIIDAPGHIEFLRNMISGAARAEAGLLVIDVAEGVQENSRRHGYLMSMLGVRQVAVCVNKMDLADYRQDAFDAVRTEYADFLARIGLEPLAFIPISAREGDNVAQPSTRMRWYDGPTVLSQLDLLEKEPTPLDKPLRLPVQDVYKFTEQGDDRRIIAGRIVTGQVCQGDEVLFLPSGKRSRVKRIEGFPDSTGPVARAGQSTALTLETQVYVKPGELMVRADEPPPQASTSLRANLFWLSPNAMVMGKRYKLKLHASRSAAYLTAVHMVIDASDLTTATNRQQVERHDVAQVTLETLKPIACDGAAEFPQTGRFVIIDDYEIAGGGVILEAQASQASLLAEHVRQREQAWVRSTLTPTQRARRHGQRPALIVITGPQDRQSETLARAIEQYLHNCGRLAYFLGLSNQLLGLDSELKVLGGREEFLRRLGETAHLFTDAGMIVITSIADLDDFELEVLEVLNQPSDLLVVTVGPSQLTRRGPDLAIETVDLQALQVLHGLLQERHYVADYQI